MSPDTRPDGATTDVASPPAPGDELLDAFAAALRAWVGRQAAVEERLTSFAFREGQATIDLPTPTSWSPLAMQVLAAASDAVTLHFLRAVRGDGRTVESLAPAGMLGLDAGDRVALAARIGVLSANGLVGRELESDRVTATPLGEAALDLIDDIERRARS